MAATQTSAGGGLMKAMTAVAALRLTIAQLEDAMEVEGDEVVMPVPSRLSVKVYDDVYVEVTMGFIPVVSAVE